ncbi:BolA family protein [Aromatoleum petrolei]|uniref:BolA/IbaG family iron-sulfur metabolism protein n=1 Tax=Aromatoleum petrolei TaxID=76116 RepID=A0ABX1MR16_9RHOO|nr:BolA family protein [Aromatoleum petrolei]NMF87582.1 BolA/IbaG family iron-sulfur metabolism protein [Aromatoleum petrolei]QTQ38679.1 Putative transcriptional regualtor, BolA family [Aromatoleum petrolei]
MSVIDEIRNRLAPLNPLSIEIEDESALHAGHAGAKGGGGHYRMTMVSDAFIGKNTVARHRLIYGALGELMRTRIHALAIRALTAEEANTQPTRKEL